MTDFDVIVIGGGATGGGTALDLALRGLRVALDRAADLTDGTSGRYHGLLHSGGRYAGARPRSPRASASTENRILRRSCRTPSKTPAASSSPPPMTTPTSRGQVG